MAYYVVERRYVGPNRGRDTVSIQTEPARYNGSGKPCLEDWAGTTNDVAVYARGTFDNEKAAREFVKHEFPSARETEDCVATFAGWSEFVIT